jgi:hypothetical protein
VYEDAIPIETPDDDQHLWRYMDFSKYVDLLTTSELHFARADRLEDPYDCSGMQFFGEPYKQLVLANPHGKERTRQVNMFGRLFVYLNCWHINDVESAALWNLYSANRYETIAIQSTFRKLESAIRDKWPQDGICISKVRYDPENAGEPCGDSSGRLFSSSGWESIIYKRPSFAHERELRAFIFQSTDKLREHGILRNEAHLKRLMQERPEYIRVKITPADVIEKVYISPHAKDFFVELVRRVSGELKDRVLKSDLYELY